MVSDVSVDSCFKLYYSLNRVYEFKIIFNDYDTFV